MNTQVLSTSRWSAALRAAAILPALVLAISGVAARAAIPSYQLLGVYPEVSPVVVVDEKLEALTPVAGGERRTSGETTITIKVPSPQIDLNAITADTSLRIFVGELVFTARLADSPSLSLSKRQAFFPFGASASDTANGLRLSWSEKLLTVEVRRKAGALNDPGWGLAGSQVERGSAAIVERVPLTLEFAGVLGQSTAYVTGNVTTGERRVNGVAMTVEAVGAKGGLDVVPPVVKVAASKKDASPAEALSVTGTVADNFALAPGLEVEYTTAPGLPESSWQKASISDRVDGIWGTRSANWSFPAGDLSTGRTTAFVRARDERGNKSEPVEVPLSGQLTSDLPGPWFALVENDERGLHGSLLFILGGNGLVPSGKLMLDMGGGVKSHPFRGELREGVMQARIARPGKTALKLRLVLDSQHTGLVDPTVSSVRTMAGRLVEEGSDEELAAIRVVRRPFSARSPAPSCVVGRYNTAFQSGSDPRVLGNSLLTLVSKSSGVLSLAGRLADGTAVTFSGLLGPCGEVEIFAPLYGGRGSLTGQHPPISVENGELRTWAPVGLHWLRPAGSGLPGGINEQLGVNTGAPYTPPAPGARIMGLDETFPLLEASWNTEPVSLSSEAEPPPPEKRLLTVSPSNAVTGVPVNSTDFVVRKVNIVTGEVFGALKLPGVAQPAEVYGVMMMSPLNINEGRTHYYKMLGYYSTPAAGRAPRRYGAIEIRVVAEGWLGLPDHIPLAQNGFVATGIQLGTLALGFVPELGQEVMLVRNTGDEPITGTFAGLSEGAAVRVKINHKLYSAVISYRGGDGNDITLTFTAGPAIKRELRYHSGACMPETQMGSSVAIDGSLVAVGMPGERQNPVNSGSVLIYQVNGGACTLRYKLSPELQYRGNEFGRSVSLSGGRLAVGMPSYEEADGPDEGTEPDCKGAVFVYEVPHGKAPELLAVIKNPTANASTSFGASVSVSGTRVAVGSDTQACVYHVVKARPPSLMATFIGESSRGWFGGAVSLSGDKLAVCGEHACLYDLSRPAGQQRLLKVGEPMAPLSACVSGNIFAVGLMLDNRTVQVYDLTRPAGDQLITDLFDPETSYGYFGHSLAISGGYLVVGAPESATSSFPAINGGCAHVFNLSRPREDQLVATLHRSAPERNEALGATAAISGSKVVLGVPGHFVREPDHHVNVGAADVFDLARPAAQRKVATLTHLLPATDELFGGYRGAVPAVQTVAFAGGKIAVSAPAQFQVNLYPAGGSRAGTPAAIVRPPAGMEKGNFGDALAGNANHLAVAGAIQGESPGVCLYNVAGAGEPVLLAWLPGTHGSQRNVPVQSLAMSNRYLAVGESDVHAGGGPPWLHQNSGRVLLYRFNADGSLDPALVRQIDNPQPATAGLFGSDVAVSDSWLAVACAGKVYVYDLRYDPLLQMAHIIPLSATSGFDIAVALSGSCLVIGDPHAKTHEGDDRGAVYVYALEGGDPTTPKRITAPVPVHQQHFGHSLALHGSRLLVGVPEDRYDVPARYGPAVLGAAYLYNLGSMTPGVPVTQFRNPAADVMESDWFGDCVAVSGDRVLIAAPADDTPLLNGGTVFVYGPP